MMESINKRDPWESLPVKKLTIDDLDTQEIINTIDESINRGRMESKFATKDPKDALRKLKLIDSGKLINAAAVLYGKDLEQYYPECLLRLVRFKGLTKKR